MIETIEHKKEKLKRLERAFIGAVSSALNYDSKEWVFNDKGRLHAVSSHFLNGNNEHDNGSIALALAKYQSSHFEPVQLKIGVSNVVKTSAGEDIYYEYNSETGSFLVPSKKQIRERSGDVEANRDLASAVENTHFNASLFLSNNSTQLKNSETLHLVFRGTEQDLDSVPFKYGIDAYTDLDKYYRQMEVFEASIFKYIEDNPNIKEFTVTGHSLGGAMAQFFHEKHKDYFESKGINFYATTFGSPGADMKPWFSKLKDNFRDLRTSLSWNFSNKAILSDIKEENAKNEFNNSQEELLNPNNNVLVRTKAFFASIVNITSLTSAYISSAINNKISDVFHYNRVEESGIFKNHDNTESKSNYLQEHYFHKYDPIPMLGGLAYDRSGDSYLLNNHIRKQKGANKFFKKIMGEHTSDAYIHNIVNEIQQIYNNNPDLKHEMYSLNPAFRSYIDGYNNINAKKAEYLEIVKAHPEIKDILVENMFSGSKKPRSQTMASNIAEFKHAQDQTMTILVNIANNASLYSKTIEPIFSSVKPLINGQEVDLTRDYSDGILPIPAGHTITPISFPNKNENDNLKITFIIDHKSIISPAIINDKFNVEYNVPVEKKPAPASSPFNAVPNQIQTAKLLNAVSIPVNSSFLSHTIDCVVPNGMDAVNSQLEKLSIYSASGKLENFLFDNNKECNLQPELNLNEYNVHAVQSFHKDYTGDRLSVSAFIAQKLGIGKDAPDVAGVINTANEIASFGATVDQIEKFSKDLSKFLNKPDVLENMKRITSERQQTELAELRERNTLRVS